MPKLIPYTLPRATSPSAGLGRLFYQAGQETGRQRKNDESAQLRNSILGFGMNLAGQAIGNEFAVNRAERIGRVQDQRAMAMADQKRQLDLQNRTDFVNMAEADDPTLASDARWNRYKAGIMQGVLDPKDAYTLMLSQDRTEASQASRDAALALQREKFGASKANMDADNLLARERFEQTKDQNDWFRGFSGQKFEESKRAAGVRESQADQRIAETKADNARVDADRDARNSYLKDTYGTNEAMKLHDDRLAGLREDFKKVSEEWAAETDPEMKTALAEQRSNLYRFIQQTRQSKEDARKTAMGQQAYPTPSAPANTPSAPIATTPVQGQFSGMGNIRERDDVQISPVDQVKDLIRQMKAQGLSPMQIKAELLKIQQASAAR